LALVAPLFFEN